MNRAQRRATVNKTDRKDLISELSKAQNQIRQDAASEAFSIAKQLASQTITSVVIPSVQAVLKETFNFTDEQVDQFMEAFSKKADEITHEGDKHEHSEESCKADCCAANH